MPTLTLPVFTTEGGATLYEVPVAYETWGTLDADKRNVLVVCHALTGNAHVDEWWGPFLGPGRPFDTDRFFVICLNIAESPYGSISALSTNPATGQPYGANLPPFTIRDTVALHKAALDQLGIQQVKLAFGGSMGGMQVLEWSFYGDFVEALAIVAVGGRHSPWCIGWSEAQRQAIYADPNWNDGHYAPDVPPAAGLAAARMMGMVSYRSHDSFVERFRRDRMDDQPGQPFSIESYLRYQGQKLVDRFDANCYVDLTLQMDTHDVARGRGAYADVLRAITQPTLIMGIDSDILYPLTEQKELANHLPHAEFRLLTSLHGHDAFLIEFDQMCDALQPWMDRHVMPTLPSPVAAY